jgi:hypothetical protein
VAARLAERDRQVRQRILTAVESLEAAKRLLGDGGGEE